METQNHRAENTISIPREKFLSMIGQLQSNFLSMVALNPQPIPPESVFISRLAFQAMDRLLTMQETADLMNKSNGNKGQIIIGDHMAELIDDLCGNEPQHIFIKKRRNPYGDTVPRPNWNEKFSGLQLVTTGVMFEKMAGNLKGTELQQQMINAGAKVIETGISRL
ncbi:hypothetical protein [Kaistella sp.]|uniref:hypothetical protein n=1 Tax=Kaistella sp. TaxID=2782235 RepID=UPI0035A1533E